MNAVDLRRAADNDIWRKGAYSFCNAITWYPAVLQAMSTKTVTLLLVIFAAGLGTASARKQVCACSIHPEFTEYVDCRPVIMRNGASVYWQFNCDSSWLTFRSAAGRERVIFSLGTVTNAGKIGYSFAFENRETFTIRDRQISGCCAPEQYRILNKNTGKEVRDFGACIWLSRNRQQNFVVRFSSRKQNELILQYLDTTFCIRIPLSPNWLHRHGNSIRGGPAELSFSDARVRAGVFSIKCSYRESASSGTDRTEIIRMRLPAMQ